jgi:hypothetical protein
MAEPGSDITQRLRELEEFRSVASYQLERLEKDQEKERIAIATVQGELFSKLGKLDEQLRATKDSLTLLIDDKVATIFTEIKTSAKSRDAHTREEIEKIKSNVAEINSTIAKATGFIVSIQIALQYLVPMLVK